MLQSPYEIVSSWLQQVLDAMNIDPNITTPVAGKIKKITVGQGDGVQVNQCSSSLSSPGGAP
jgi:acetyl/propionyl-CoA carboxylase alpha subunit